MKLTKVTVPRIGLPDGKSEVIVFDESLAGFGLRVRAGGKRTWIAQYRVGLKQRRVTLGSLDKFDPDQARKLARDTLARVQLGADPQIEKFQVRNEAAITFGVVRDKYLAQAEARLGPRTYSETHRHLNRHWAPLAQLPLAGIRRSNIAGRMGEIATENGPYAANRARASLSAFFSWAIGEGIAEMNPVVGTNKAIDEQARDRVLSDAEIARVWRAAASGDYGRIVRLLILTGQRREEVGGMLWSEIDPAKALWSIGRDRTKNGLAHDVPLSGLALLILAGQPRRDKRDLVFGESAGPFQGWSNAKTAIDTRTKLANDKKAITSWRLHDLRRTVATRLGDLGVLPHVVEAILNHISGSKAGVAGIYNRASYAAEKREALDRWASHLAAIVGET